LISASRGQLQTGDWQHPDRRCIQKIRNRRLVVQKKALSRLKNAPILPIGLFLSLASTHLAASPFLKEGFFSGVNMFSTIISSGQAQFGSFR
jgi:hypothetical protein